ncbi:MAG: peptide chain release factor 1 [Acidobacteria bacterium]|nr:peptide chain release factor 1 [Acidobacteriota bacterium]MBK7599725.1 peptide chain release factor 1 [Acidobacteriota bacterium]MBK8312852.1 peptide chain release factor 1 [Acidobacteriota bacterium]MBK9706660.1 peptide chain release factor 1 [Acidobacteriota bacterium]
MLEKLEAIEKTYEELTQQMSDPNIIGDQSRYSKVAKQHRDLEAVVEKYRELKKIDSDIAGNREILREMDDAEMRELAGAELPELEARREEVDKELKLLLLPTDPNDEKNVILEIRAGTGGDEACLFAAEILRMYARYAETQGWKLQVTDSSETGLGGIQKAEAIIEGARVYSKLKYESGVHRVQRVPQTEASGRIHTSAITVAVLPEAEEVDVKIDAKDIRTDTFCSSGPGGQSVNTTYSAVRLTHLPTGLVVSMQDEKSQIKNREKAMRILRSRLLEMEQQKQQDAISAERRSQVGSGDRSEKIRTYNFKENRVTDHRIGLTLHQLDRMMEGEIGTLIDSVVSHYQAEKLKEETEKQAAMV